MKIELPVRITFETKEELQKMREILFYGHKKRPKPLREMANNLRLKIEEVL